jgi:hypothetical protein
VAGKSGKLKGLWTVRDSLHTSREVGLQKENSEKDERERKIRMTALGKGDAKT